MTVYKDPFLGKCIHGMEGAQIIGDSSISPDCDVCNPISEIVMSSGEWMTFLHPNMIVLDPDGWDRSDLQNSWNEDITKAEFEARFDKSTVGPALWKRPLPGATVPAGTSFEEMKKPIWRSIGEDDDDTPLCIHGNPPPHWEYGCKLCR